MKKLFQLFNDSFFRMFVRAQNIYTNMHLIPRKRYPKGDEILTTDTFFFVLVQNKNNPSLMNDILMRKGTRILFPAILSQSVNSQEQSNGK